MKTITVVGAGFSGLVTAYLLTKAGRQVRVIEKTARAGGLIHTIRTEHGLIETAANGLLNSARVESMCADIGVPLIPTRREARKRFIYRGKPRRLPVGLSEALRIPLRMALNAMRILPQQLETIADWGGRVLGRDTTEYLLVPALGGIYAGDPNRLSASLIFGSADLPAHLQTYRPQTPKIRGTVAPPKGMQQLIDGLVDYLRNQSVEMNFETEAQPNANEPTIVCLSAPAAATYLSSAAPEVAASLAQIEMLSLVTTTAFFKEDAATIRGFGCLFPSDQEFRARGVLFNDSIFQGRGPAHSESWIFGGALDSGVVKLNDEEITSTILKERERLYRRQDTPLSVHITRWPNALPHYSVDLERILAQLPSPPPNVALVGNYLGRIGLTKILERGAYIVENTAQNWR